MASEQEPSLVRRWSSKFGCALRGVAVAFREEDSFVVHLPAAVAVMALASWRGVERFEWLLLVLCVAIVIAAELFNSAIERLSTVVTREVDPTIRDALDIASGAVLVVAAGAAVVGAVLLF